MLNTIKSSRLNILWLLTFLLLWLSAKLLVHSDLPDSVIFMPFKADNQHLHSLGCATKIFYFHHCDMWGQDALHVWSPPWHLWPTDPTLHGLNIEYKSFSNSKSSYRKAWLLSSLCAVLMSINLFLYCTISIKLNCIHMMRLFGLLYKTCIYNVQLRKHISVLVIRIYYGMVLWTLKN